ncbi:MAG: N-acetylmuramoyl-L-alanine amidase [Clostridia bacterium]|nr:N-acetylmuramoyl-L-alanine amidase [Clostridia bacterium]
MRKKHKKKNSALAVKQSAILFFCAVLCCALIIAAMYIARNTIHEATVEPVPTATPLAEDIPSDTPLPSAAPSTAPSAEPTRSPIVLEEAPADPLQVLLDNTHGKFEGEYVELPLTGLVIGIDPGHQAKGNSEQEPVSPGSTETKAKVSSGTQGRASGIPEYVTNLVVSLQLRDALEALGAQVYMSRTENNVDISNIERALMFNEIHADVVLRIHCNGSTNADAEGIGLYVTKSGPIAEESYEIASVLLDAMVSETGAEKDGVFRRDTYSGLNWSEVPSMIVEMGFMTNLEEDMRLQDPEYQQKLVSGMVKGIAKYYSREIRVQ